MAAHKSPAFQFYAQDFLTGTATMTLAEVGAYVKLLAHQWHAGSVPRGTRERARILGCSLAVEKTLWVALEMKFTAVDDGYQNARLEEERRKQAEYRRRQSDKGKASAATKRQPDVNHGSTTVESRLQPDGNSSVFGLRSSSSVDPSKNDGSVGAPSARPQPLIDRGLSAKWDKKHGYHVPGFCDWCCLDEQQVAEFVAKIPGDDYALKTKQVQEWADEIRRQWADRIIPDGSHFDFWRNRWTETHGGSRPANATLKAVRAASAIDEAFR